MVHYRVHSGPSLVRILNQMDSVHILTTHFSILMLASLLRLVFSSGLFPSGFPIRFLYAFLISPMRATFPAHLLLLELITLIISYEAYKL